MAIIVGRAVRTSHRGTPGPIRHILRGIGMGGTASGFIWNPAYDPIVEGAQIATGAPPPAHVDDLAGLVVGAAHLHAASHFLMRMLLKVPKPPVL